MHDDAADLSLSPAQREALTTALDEIVPPSRDGTLPGAGELGLASYVEAMLRRSPALQRDIPRGLAALDALAQRRACPTFAALPQGQRVEVLREVATEPAGESFLAALVATTYGGYYQHPRVLRALGREARAPWPEGYAMEPFDPALLEDVRRRPKQYRTC